MGIVGVHVITVHYVQVEYYQTFKNYTPPTQFHLMENSLIGFSFSDVEKKISTFRGRTLSVCEVAGTGTRKQCNIDVILVGIWWLQLIFLMKESERRVDFLISIGLLVALAIISLLIFILRTDKQFSISLKT